jgi:hypothetical protein
MSPTACDPYAYPSNCPYPNNGYSKSNLVPAHGQHLNYFAHLLSTTPSEIVFNLIFITVCVWLLYRYLWGPFQPIMAGLRNFQRLRSSQTVFLEITPHAKSDSSPVATQELYKILAEIIGSDAIISLEYAASRDRGTRFLIRVSENDSATLQRKLASLLPSMQCSVLSGTDRPEHVGSGSFQSIMELRQVRHYAFPLKKQQDADEHDLAHYIGTAMAKLEAGETINLQLITSPQYAKATNRLRNNYSITNIYPWIIGYGIL